MTTLTRTAICINAFWAWVAVVVNIRGAIGFVFARRVICTIRAVFAAIFAVAYTAGALGLIDDPDTSRVIGNALLATSVAFWPLVMVLPPLLRMTADPLTRPDPAVVAAVVRQHLEEGAALDGRDEAA